MTIEEQHTKLKVKEFQVKIYEDLITELHKLVIKHQTTLPVEYVLDFFEALDNGPDRAKRKLVPITKPGHNGR